MSKLELLLLGRFECLLSSGTRIALSMRKAEVLLAFLAIAPGIRHPRERLINLLWSDRGDEQARNSLRQALSSIKKSLGDVGELALQIDRTTVSLNPELIEVDALEFERLATVGDYESLTSAADLYQGEFLAGIAIRDAACQEWLDSERQRFRRQFIEILANLAETQLLSHDYGHAIASAERLVEQDPLGEAHWRLLMRAYADSDDRSHALQAFKRCRQALRDELEVEPESATVELREQIAGGRSESIPSAASIKTSAPPAPDGNDHSIAVLPFDNLSGDPEQEYFSDGITDSIILNLSRFPRLLVKSRYSSFAFKEQIKSLGEISHELGVDYIVEGSIRKSEQRIRITVQLIEADSGNQVWGKRYDAALADLFTLEEDLSRAIAVTVTGRIESDLQRVAIAKGAAEQQAYDLLLSGIFHSQSFNRQDTVIAIDKLNQCLARDPDNVRAHVALFTSHIMDYLGRWTEDYQASFRLAEQHIRRALELDPGSGLVQAFYGEFLNFDRELEASAKHIDIALKINPNDPNALAVRALNLELRGKFEAGLEAGELAVSLDPYHPWAEWEVAGGQYMCGRYQDALDTITKFRTSPGFIDMFIVAAHIKLGQSDRARQALQTYLQACREDMLSMPQSLDEWWQFTRQNYPYADEAINQDLFDCLVQAGLENELSPVTAQGADSELPSIAVLPFENMSGDAEQEHFSDGITSDIIATLSRFKHLNTVSRYSVLQYKEQRASICEIAQQQNVRYLLEGSVRKSGERIRVSAELIDAQDRSICWSERYDRDLGDLFAVQDEITQSIALAMKVHLDDGDMALHRSRGASSVEAWELVMAAIDLQDTYIRDNILESRRMARRAIELDPAYAYARVCLAWTFWQEVYSGWSESVDAALKEAGEANRKAHELNPDYSEAWSQAGMIHLMNHEADEAVAACARAVELEPGNAEVQALMAFCLVFTGDLDRARFHQQKVVRLCPMMPNWYYLVSGQIDQFQGNLDAAIRTYQNAVAVEPESPLGRFYLIHALMEKGDESGAHDLAREIRSLDRAVRGRGLVRALCTDPAQRDRFRAHLEKFELY